MLNLLQSVAFIKHNLVNTSLCLHGITCHTVLCRPKCKIMLHLRSLVLTNPFCIISEYIQLEDLEDSTKMRNQWLLRTPRKSFYMAAVSYEEKRAWIEHIEECQSRLHSAGSRPRPDFAVTWIPDQASAVCMRCSNSFSVAHRRHHCRKCGFVVCGACSKKRAVIEHIHPTKSLRVCNMCHSSLSTRGSSTDKICSDEDEVDWCSEEEEAEEQLEAHDPSRWMDSLMEIWSTYVYLKPEHVKPLT